MSARAFATLLAALVACVVTWPAALAAETQPCRQITQAGHGYTACTFDLSSYTLRLFWRDKDGAAYGSLDRLLAVLGASAKPVFAMNAGMYDPERAPIGLYVEQGVELKAANIAEGPGNFHLKPNGVFYVEGASAGILETSAYLARRLKPDLATQSGPMLVIDGQLHPKFLPQSTSLRIRNGVGVSDPHTVVFAISAGPVTFRDFATLFRDVLGCRDALFLDGTISSLFAPSLGYSGSTLPAGPMIAVFRR